MMQRKLPQHCVFVGVHKTKLFSFGEVQLSLLVAGALFCETQLPLLWQVQYSVKFKCHFSRQAHNLVKFETFFFFNRMFVVSAKSNLGCEAGCGLTGSCPDHARIHPVVKVDVASYSQNVFLLLRRGP